MEAIEKAAESAEEIINRHAAANPELQKTLLLVRRYLEDEQVLCYGGTAINNLLPDEDRFYDPDIDIPDYDFFSKNPQRDAMRLADRMDHAGITRVEVRPGVHLGTFKVFANYTGVADITYLDAEIFDKLWDEKVEKDGIHYVSPDFLRMSIYLELSRPRGDVGRWKKVYTRLQLLNKHYPIVCPPHKDDDPALLEKTAPIAKYLASHKVVLMGLHASQLHTERRSRGWELPIDLLVAQDHRAQAGRDLARILKADAHEQPAVGEILPPHTDLRKNGHLLARVYENNGCHSFHKMKGGLRVASIPTLLHFFFASLYADKHTHKDLDPKRLICVAQQLVEVAHGEKGSRRYDLLTPIDCLGWQETLIDVRNHTAETYDTLSKKGKTDPEFLRYFFTYSPRSTTKTQKQKLKEGLRKTYRKSRTERI